MVAIVNTSNVEPTWRHVLSDCKEANEEEDEEEGNYHIEGGIGPLNKEIEGAPTTSLEQPERGILATSPRCICISSYSNCFSITNWASIFHLDD